jgi:predicted dehydrogenase
MAPLISDGAAAVSAPDSDSSSDSPSPHRPRLLIIGAGSRGNSYARAVVDSGLATIAAVAEPLDFKRKLLASKYIWPTTPSQPEHEFTGWKSFIKYEEQRRKDEAAGVSVPPGVDGAFICIRDEHHIEVITAIAPLGLHIMSEKPLATTLSDCLAIEKSLRAAPERIFAIGHVLRYSPHNMLLRHLVREQRVIGDIISIEHTEPVGFWHFSHSYVRGNWRKESVTAPSLLTKSCHDIDFLLWMLCSPVTDTDETVHLPARLTSSGSLKQFRKSQKPKEAGSATNCLSCPIQDTCQYSAPRIYHDKHLAQGITKWPIDIVNPEIEHILPTSGPDAAKAALFRSLSADYSTTTTPLPDIEDRAWYGRCVWESDNDVCDDQHVTLEWDDSPETDDTPLHHHHHTAKTASFHMIAQSLAQCERRGRIYGTAGEISYDSATIVVHDFRSDRSTTHSPEVPANSHHGGGDDGLTRQFIRAIVAANGGVAVAEAQVRFLGCTWDEIVRSHAVVFAAEEARRGRKVVEWGEWWEENVVRARDA